MTYTPTTWVNGTTPASAANMNNIETGISGLDSSRLIKTGDTMSGALGISMPGNTVNALTMTFPSVPASNQSIMYATVTADSSARFSLSIRSDGYGMLGLGSGTAASGYIYGTASGLRTDNDITTSTNVNAANIVASGNLVCGTSSAIFLGNLMICQAYFAVRKNDGTKLFECRANGDFTISGVTLRTAAGSSSGYGTGGVFDTFDIAETYTTDMIYEAGTVLEPQGDVYTLCREDGSAFAVVVSEGGGVLLGPNEDDVNEVAVPIALTGRVRVSTSEDIQSRQWVTSTSDGKVRAIKKGETAFTLGYALHPTHNGKVGVFLRPCMMTVKP